MQGPVHTRGRDALALTVCSLVILRLLWVYGDTGGYEGDDMSIATASLYLDAAREGMFTLYRYDWQPLGYQLNRWVFGLTGSEKAIFHLAAIGGACTLWLLSIAMQRASQYRLPAWLWPLWLVLIPEFFHSALYYNTTMVGLPFAAGAMLLVTPMAQSGRPGSRGDLAAICAGALGALATLLRFDFLLIGPMLFALSIRNLGGLRPAALLVLTFAGVMLTTMLGGLYSLSGLVQVLRDHDSAMSVTFAFWDWKAQVKVVACSLHISLWLFAPVAVWHAGREELRRFGPGRLGLMVAASLPLLLPLKDIASPKYLLPLFLFGAPLLARYLGLISLRMGRPRTVGLVALLIAVAAFSFFVSVEPRRTAPFIAIQTVPTVSMSHDGSRSLGAYYALLSTTRADGTRQHAVDLAEALARRTVADEENLLFIGVDSSFRLGHIGFRRAQLRLHGMGRRAVPDGPGRMRYPGAQHALLIVTPDTVRPEDRAWADHVIEAGFDERGLDNAGRARWANAETAKLKRLRRRGP